jgi:hypothetical protein
VDSDLFKRLVIGAYPPEIFVAHATTGPTSVLVRANSFSLEAARRQWKKSAKAASNDGGRRSMERTGQCHCGSLRVITTGEPDRVYLCHCQACQRRTGTAFHFGASFPKEQVRLDGERKVYERDAYSGYRIRFHFCPNCGTTLYWEGDRNPAVCGVAVGAFDISAFPPPSDSIWEESLHQWLGLPPNMEHHRQGRPPVP